MFLYEKHRPTSFDQMVGSKENLEALKKVFAKKSEDRPHVFLFCGDTGTGKTTAARICVSMLGVRNSIEVNVAVDRGIDLSRSIEEDIRTSPLLDKYWVYILDEVHEMTRNLQEALLKLLEDVPDYVYFFLCTSEEKKILPKIKHRCDVYRFEVFQEKYIKQLVNRVCKKENIELTEKVLTVLCTNSDGSARKALTLLENVSNLDDEKSQLSVLKRDSEDPVVLDLCRKLLSSDKWEEISDILKGLSEEIEKIRYCVLGYMAAVILKGRNNKAAFIIECFSTPFYNVGKPGLVLACYQSFFLNK
ncbi:MAG: AAA family ATPase [Patescibacteria group bacterium]|jgi:DNA polymerase-3 subunit gamma/tau